MQLVVVEDRPWKLEESVKEMKEEGIQVNQMVYVCRDRENVDEVSKKYLKNLEENLDIQIITTDNEQFEQKMEEIYRIPDKLILCDFNLTGDKREYFEKRVNVIFAKKKMSAEEPKNPSKRIWFYTTAGEATNEQINTVFPKRNISVLRMEEDQVILDIDEVKDALEMNTH